MSANFRLNASVTNKGRKYSFHLGWEYFLVLAILTIVQLAGWFNFGNWWYLFLAPFILLAAWFLFVFTLMFIISRKL